MKISVFAVAIALSIPFVACKKKSDASAEPKAQVKLLTKIAKVGQGRTDTAFTYITYDSKNRISEMKTGNAIKAYNYTGDDLTSITTKDASGATLTTLFSFTYSNGVVSGGRRPHPTPSLDYTYTYNVSNGKVTKRNGPPQYSHEFTYTGNNLGTWKLIGSGTATYQYGLDKSPFYNSRYRYCLVLPTEDDDIFSENNVISLTYETTPYFRGILYSYRMGNDGFPRSATIKATQVLDPEKFNITEVVYSYTMIDVAN